MNVFENKMEENGNVELEVVRKGESSSFNLNSMIRNKHSQFAALEFYDLSSQLVGKFCWVRGISNRCF